MNALETHCEGCHKRISADSLEQFEERAVRHVRNCAALRSVAASRIPDSAVVRFGRSLAQSAKGAVHRARLSFSLARGRR